MCYIPTNDSKFAHITKPWAKFIADCGKVIRTDDLEPLSLSNTFFSDKTFQEKELNISVSVSVIRIDTDDFKNEKLNYLPFEISNTLTTLVP